MLRIRTLEPEDLEQTARLHRAYLKLGLFPKMGRSFLERYQETFLRSPYGIALVARDDDEILGALFGTASNAEHYRWVVRNCGMELALAGCGALLTRPALAWTFASTRLGRYMRGLTRHAARPSKGQGGTKASAAPVSVLTHIVTSENARRRGIGRKLVRQFKAEAREQGARRALLITEEGGMGTPFFEKIGAICVGQRKAQDGSMVREYKMTLEERGLNEGMGTYRRRRRVFTGTYRPQLGAAARSYPSIGPIDAR